MSRTGKMAKILSGRLILSTMAALIIISIFTFPTPVQQAYAQTTFGSIVNLSQNSGSSFNAQVATLGNNVYTVWTDNTPGNFEIFFRKSTDGGSSFGPIQQLTSTPTLLDVNPSIAVAQVGANTHVYITYTEGLFAGICFDCEVRLLRSTNDGASFEAPVNISNTPGSGSGDSHVAAAGNFVFVAWGEFPPPGFPNSEIFLRRSIDGGVSFESPQQISFSGFFSFTPRIALNLPNVHIVWGDNGEGFVGVGGLGEILYRRSTNNGASFDPVVNLSSNIDDSNGADIAVSGSNVHVVWAERTSAGVPIQVVYKRSINDGVSFGATTTLSLLSGFGGQSYFTGVAAMGTDVFVVFSDKSSGNEEILFMESNNNGGTFSSAVNLSNNSGASQFPDIAVSDLSSVHVTWHDNTPTNFDIFYTTSTVTVPFAAFNAEAEIELGLLANDEFEVEGTFTLGAGSDGIDPLTEIVALELSGGSVTFSTTIPAGSFVLTNSGPLGEFEFEGIVDGVSLEVKIRPLPDGTFEFEAEGKGANLTGLANPVTVGLLIGNDGGSTTVDAEFE